jgi:hypothetical protein
MINLTQPISKDLSLEELMSFVKIDSWFYTNTGRYGSPEHDRREDKIEEVFVAADRKSVQLILKEFEGSPRWLDRIYHIQLKETQRIFSGLPVKSNLRAYFTLRSIPQ